ncbi:uncharacterized protein [Nicotiana tomentosiformis]|uniref:uncharacterized protein n=1 Tax=Nicotiana tomentosiformis TaxID=4098 RepID=UPI00388C687C
MVIVEVSGVAFTTFQLSGAANQWWQVYEEGRPADAIPPTWAQFSKTFLKKFSELARHAPTLVPTVRERDCRFIEGIDFDLKICMAQELQTDTPFQQVVEITRRIERVLGEERESKEAKSSSAMTHYGGGSSSQPAQSRHQITLGAQVSSYSAPPTRDSYSGYFSYPAQT